ncbi:hypothetical protein ACSLOK_23390 [Escherichia coli]|uniref:hypothetical protein n=1 Tax=Escherichia coli TaxID=562 RepID=UPI003EE3CF89
MIANVVYKNGDVKTEELTVDDAAVRLKTDSDVQAIEFFERGLNTLLEKKLEQALVLGLK